MKARVCVRSGVQAQVCARVCVSTRMLGLLRASTRIHITLTGAHPGFRRQRVDKMDPFELVLIFHFNTPSKGKKFRQISVGIKPYYHEILTAVVDLTQRLSTLSI